MNERYRSVIRQKIIDMQSQRLPSLTKRDVWLPQVPNKAMVIIGIRRCGKTSFMWQMIRQSLQKGSSRESLLYFSLEDERLHGIESQDLSLIVEEFYRLNPLLRDQKQAVFFLDEIQLVEGWESFARRILDTEKIQLYLSGSSAKMLSREVATNMRGRALEVQMTPFSFREFLRHKGLEPSSLTRLTKAKRSLLDAKLIEYLTHGGFPEVQNLDQRNRFSLLRNYIDVVLLRDIIERHNVRQPQVLRWLVQQLLTNPAGLFSIHKFYGDLKSRGVSVAKDTLYQMLDFLEDAFLVYTLPLATDSIRRQQVNQRKVYPVDTGFIALYDLARKTNLGHALETVVLHWLLRAGGEVGYFLTQHKHEIDFQARMPNGETWLVQVCLDISTSETLDREIRPFIELKKSNLKTRNILIVLYSDVTSLSIDLPQDMEIVSASEWLLTSL